MKISTFLCFYWCNKVLIAIISHQVADENVEAVFPAKVLSSSITLTGCEFNFFFSHVLFCPEFGRPTCSTIWKVCQGGT